jgi:hypothetical protein
MMVQPAKPTATTRAINAKRWRKGFFFCCMRTPPAAERRPLLDDGFDTFGRLITLSAKPGAS